MTGRLKSIMQKTLNVEEFQMAENRKGRVNFESQNADCLDSLEV